MVSPCASQAAQSAGVYGLRPQFGVQAALAFLCGLDFGVLVGFPLQTFFSQELPVVDTGSTWAPTREAGKECSQQADDFPDTSPVVDTGKRGVESKWAATAVPAATGCMLETKLTSDGSFTGCSQGLPFMATKRDGLE